MRTALGSILRWTSKKTEPEGSQVNPLGAEDWLGEPGREGKPSVCTRKTSVLPVPCRYSGVGSMYRPSERAEAPSCVSSEVLETEGWQR